MGSGNVKFAEAALKGLVLRHAFPSIQPLQARIQPGDIHVSKTFRTTPYTAHKQEKQLLRRITLIGPAPVREEYPVFLPRI